jgi:carboxymethylenebutenolidase
MSSEDKDLYQAEASPTDPSRRDFVALSAAVGLAATTGTVAAAERGVEGKDVTIQTPDGNCDAAFYYPTTGKHPAVLIWTDIFGLRPTFRRMAQRLAASGYAVLVPNPFYRTQKAPVIEESEISKFDFRNPADQKKMGEWTAPINAPGAIEKDAKAHLAFLDAQSQVDTSKKAGTQGYCMGGPLVFKTAAAVPDRIGGAATFHGGGLVTDKPDSPHLLIPQWHTTDAYIAIATSDDVRQPDAKDKLREAFKAANLKATVIVYQGMQHGWTVPDMPHQPNGKPIYNKAEADRAWGHLLALYKETLV